MRISLSTSPDELHAYLEQEGAAWADWYLPVRWTRFHLLRTVLTSDWYHRFAG